MLGLINSSKTYATRLKRIQRRYCITSLSITTGGGGIQNNLPSTAGIGVSPFQRFSFGRIVVSDLVLNGLDLYFLRKWLFLVVSDFKISRFLIKLCLSITYLYSGKSTFNQNLLSLIE